MIRDIDRLFDFDHDGELDAFERNERDEFEEELIKEFDGDSDEEE